MSSGNVADSVFPAILEGLNFSALSLENGLDDPLAPGRTSVGNNWRISVKNTHKKFEL